MSLEGFQIRFRTGILKKKKKKTSYFVSKHSRLTILWYFWVDKQKDSAMHIPVSILSRTLIPSRLPRSIEQSFLCYTIGPCWQNSYFVFKVLQEFFEWNTARPGSHLCGAWEPHQDHHLAKSDCESLLPGKCILISEMLKCEKCTSQNCYHAMLLSFTSFCHSYWVCIVKFKGISCFSYGTLL